MARFKLKDIGTIITGNTPKTSDNRNDVLRVILMIQMIYVLLNQVILMITNCLICIVRNVTFQNMPEAKRVLCQLKAFW